MNEKLPPDDHPVTRTEAEGATVDLPKGLGFFHVGQVLGDRYEILEMLGRGGMGEVWRAFDLKLRVEVGLKALRDDLFQSERRLELLRQEVRAAREVVSPNVCRIFDLIEIDGRELVSMEYVDGATLLGVLQERGPLELKEAQDIASQFLSGLEAIHRAGLVHRDVKPENIMLTRAGRVVVMDFGLARGPESGAGSVSGTPAYMAPEHAAGGDVDARADVYSAGVVLAEMVSPEGIRSYQSRQSVWEGVRSEPAKIPDTPWAPVINRAVARDRKRRQNSAHTLIRELEDVTLRVEGADDLHPYPGLASFTEEDAEYFFGREAEVEQMWRRIEGPPRMLVLVGPSGAGKTSFLQAGLLANAGVDWSCVVCKPGNNPQLALGRALAHEVTGDAEAMELMLRFDDPDVATEIVFRWRHRATNALLVVDQFEELFTQSGVEEQRRFSDLLAQIVLTANVHVLLSMRDDFLMRCHDHEAFAPVFSDLTPLRAPTGAALRRALVQPATKCGYRFEDDDLVEEILSEVEGERGALPLLAFALARLWENRDRDTGLLTRQAYHDIGGVGGALARHAEATIDHIGVERIPIVRELFRNLVTAEGTRAVREWDELLSVFDGSGGEGVKPSPTKKPPTTVGAGFTPAREAAADVLRELIDARLLTSYEVREDEHEPTRRVEIIHESLLANWPRLVRWQTRDADAVQMREQLRQAAKMWDDHDRSDDTLWTGSAYREFALWREHYPGGLTEIEEAFAAAMTSFAMRRRRRRQIAATAAVVVFAAVALVFAGLWRRSVEEARRAEAANLVSLGQLELEPYPSATVAYTIASLEQNDGPSARRLALEALWKGPAALVAANNVSWGTQFSPDGQWLVQAQIRPEEGESHLSIFHADGTREILEDEHSGAPWIGITAVTDTGHFVSFAPDSESSIKYAVWSASKNQPLATMSSDSSRLHWGAVVDSDRRRALLLIRDEDRINVDALWFDGTHENLGTLDFKTERDEAGKWTTLAALDPRAGAWLGVVTGSEVYVVDVLDYELGPPRLLGRHDGVLPLLACDPLGRFIATAAEDGEFCFWNRTATSPPMIFQGPVKSPLFRFSADGSLFEATSTEDEKRVAWVWALSGNPPRFLRRFNLGPAQFGNSPWETAGRQLASGGDDLKFRTWSIDAPHDADPVILSRGDIQGTDSVSINPRGGWLATGDGVGLAFWPLTEPFPMVFRKHDQNINSLVFAPDGSWLASSSNDGTVRLWPLEGDPPLPGRTLLDLDNWMLGLAASPDGERILVGTHNRGVHLLPPEGGASKILRGFSQRTSAVAFSPDGRLAAAVGGQFITTDRMIRVWDVATGEEVAVLEFGEQPVTYSLRFVSDDLLFSLSESGLLQWNIKTGVRKLLYEGTSRESISRFATSADGRRVVMVERDNVKDGWGKVVLLELDSGTVTHLTRFGDEVTGIALNATGTFAVTGDLDGEVRVGLLTAEQPHLFTGHTGSVWALAIDPKGRWIASGGNDTTVRLWPMPDLSKPPLHTLPREELIAKLKTLTNLRVVRDPESATGWKLTHDPFPGWETVPTW